MVARFYSVLNDGDVGLPPHKCRRLVSKVAIALRLIKLNNGERFPARWKPDEPLFLEGLETIWQSFGPDLNFSGKAQIV